jgi:hypothetical protein
VRKLRLLEKKCMFCFALFCFETGSHYVAQAGLELGILLPSQCLDYRCVPPCLVKKYALTGLETFMFSLWTTERAFLADMWLPWASRGEERSSVLGRLQVRDGVGRGTYSWEMEMQDSL